MNTLDPKVIEKHFDFFCLAVALSIVWCAIRVKETFPHDAAQLYEDFLAREELGRCPAISPCGHRCGLLVNHNDNHYALALVTGEDPHAVLWPQTRGTVYA